jgi:hypothetical protein
MNTKEREEIWKEYFDKLLKNLKWKQEYATELNNRF